MTLATIEATTEAAPAPAAATSLTTQAAPAAEPAAAPESTNVPATEAGTEASQAAQSPIEYGEFTTPEGAYVDPELHQQLLVTAREAGMTQTQVQALIDLGATMQTKAMAQHQASIEATHQEWRAASAQDKEFGGDKFQENMGIVAKAVEVYATPELKALLDSTGLGNHPDMVRVFYRAGLSLQEDNPFGAAGGSTIYHAKDLYPLSQHN